MRVRVDVEGLAELVQRLGVAPGQLEGTLKETVKSIGAQLVPIIQEKLEPHRYTGAMQQAVRVLYRGGKMYETRVGPGPQVAHRFAVRHGTLPHYSRIEPLKAWAAAKLGDPEKAYAVQESIAVHGTSQFSRGLYGRVGKHGGGVPYPRLALSDPRTLSIAVQELVKLGRDFVVVLSG